MAFAVTVGTTVAVGIVVSAALGTAVAVAIGNSATLGDAVGLSVTFGVSLLPDGPLMSPITKSIATTSTISPATPHAHPLNFSRTPN